MSRYRLFAQAVAIFDLVMSTIAMLWIIEAVMLAGALAAVAKDAFGLVNATIWVLCVLVAIGTIIIALHMWTAIRLLSATQTGRDSVEALRLVSTWITASVVLLVVETVSLLFEKMYIEFAINLVLRGAMICIVVLYMNELKSSALPPIVSVTVQN